MQFTLCTYSRRKLSASQVAEPKQVKLVQQARCDHLGLRKDIDIENSAGRTIELKWAVSYLLSLNTMYVVRYAEGNVGGESEYQFPIKHRLENT